MSETVNKPRGIAPERRFSDKDNDKEAVVVDTPSTDASITLIAVDPMPELDTGIMGLNIDAGKLPVNLLNDRSRFCHCVVLFLLVFVVVFEERRSRSSTGMCPVKALFESERSRSAQVVAFVPALRSLRTLMSGSFPLQPLPARCNVVSEGIEVNRHAGKCAGSTKALVIV